MFDPGGVGEWSPPQSPRVHPRSRTEGALGDLGGRKKANHHICGFRHLKGPSTEVSAPMSSFQSKWRKTSLLSIHVNVDKKQSFRAGAASWGFVNRCFHGILVLSFDTRKESLR